MAHDSAKKPEKLPTSDLKTEPTTTPEMPAAPEVPPLPPPRPSLKSIDIILEDDSVDVDVDDGGTASIDKLLAMTDEGWSIEGQVKSLQEAAQGPPSVKVPVASDSSKKPAVLLPTPFDIAGPKGGGPPPLPGSGPPPLPGARPPAPSLDDLLGPRDSSEDLGDAAAAAQAILAKADVPKPAPSSRPETSEVKPESKPDLVAKGDAPLPKPPPLPRSEAKAEAKSEPSPEPPAARSVKPPPLPASKPSKPPPPMTPSRRPPPPPPMPREGKSAMPPATRPPSLAPPPPRTMSDVAEVRPESRPVSRAPAVDAGRTSKGPPPLPARALPPEVAQLFDLLGARVALLETADDKVGLGRVHLELSILAETYGDDARATSAAEAALRVDAALPAAHAILRRRSHGRPQLSSMLAHLDHEIEQSTTEAATVELLVERARLLDALGDREATQAAWELSLARAPNHSAALKGLESDLYARTLDDSTDSWEAWILHLSKVSDAYAAQPELAAWIQVERALTLDFRLGRTDAARGAFERAIRLDPSSRPVRRAYAQYLASHGDYAALARALEEESAIEPDRARAARLELDAATIAHKKLRDDTRAVDLLERAATRSPTTPLVDRRVLDDLVRLHEIAGHWSEAARVRRKRLHFFTEPQLVVHELRTLAQIDERLNDPSQAVIDLDRARSLDPNDQVLVEELDRVLAAQGRDEERVSLFYEESQRVADPTKRAKALVRAAQIADARLGQPNEALKHLRAAWVSAPGDPEVTDGLSRLMSPTPPEHVDRELRALIELYMQAAQATVETGRRIAYLEKAATLWEDLVGDPRRAARIYEEILDLEPGRRGAVLGLARTASRLGDERAAAKALLEESRLADDGVLSQNLRVRAANALAKHDASRAMALVTEVLAADSAHAGARALETRLHEEAGRWDLVAQSLRARIDTALTTQEKVPLYLALAQVQTTRLRQPLGALESLKAARVLDAVHPVPAEEIARVLESAEDNVALRDACAALADDAITPMERAYHLMRAAEIDELALGDDESAARLYARALQEMPEEEALAERLDRVLLRRGVASIVRDEGTARFVSQGLDERRVFLQKRNERALAPEAAKALKLDLALTLHHLGKDTSMAVSLLESVLEDEPRSVPALRLLEHVERRSHAWVPLSRILAQQGAAFADARARLGALWSVAWLEEWRLPPSEAVTTYERILELDPTDPGALEAVVRKQLPNARRGDRRARGQVVAALRSLSALATDEGPLLAAQLRTALLVEAHEKDVTEDEVQAHELAREALERYRAALYVEPMSVTAATGLARLANRLGDTSGAVMSAISLADLAINAPARARYLIDAADLLLGDGEDDRLGTRDNREHRAADLLDKALTANPDNIEAATKLSQVRVALGQAERLVDSFRTAIGRAKDTAAIVALGSEIAKVARDELRDLVVAIDAMRFVQRHAPDHVPSLLTLSELCIAQRAWPEATETLEHIAERGREPAPRLTALFALASIYEKILGRPEDAEGALRRALTVDEANPRAIRALIHHLAAKAQNPDLDAQKKLAPRLEIAALLERLAAVEKDKTAKCDILLELADQRVQLKDQNLAEKALVEAVAQAPQHAKAFARLGRFFKGPTGFDAVSYARALAAVIGRGQQLGHEDARWYATLGHIEVDALGRLRDGASHLKKAVAMQPLLHESRFELAQAYGRMGAHDEASKTLLGMIAPVADPLGAISDPAAALELLEKSLSAERRGEEAIVISELRAICGELDEGRHAWLRARRLGAFESHHAVLDRQALVGHILPSEGRHVLLEVAAAVAGLETRILRADLTELGVTSRDKIGKRSGHPTRTLLDRVMKALGLSDVDLLVSDRVTRTRVIAQDTLWVVVPRSLTELPEPTQLAALARALSRIAYGAPWLEELPPPHIEALLVACARVVVPTYGAEDMDVLSQKLVGQYEPSVAKEITRKQRQALEKLIPHLGAKAGKPIAIDVLIGALAKAELRAAYVLTGDVLATIDELRGLDVALLNATENPGRDALLAVLGHPFAGDVARFALTPESTALRRRVGSIWAG